MRTKEREQQEEKEEWEGHEEQVELDEHKEATKGKAAQRGSTKALEETWPAVQRTAITTRSAG